MKKTPIQWTIMFLIVVVLSFICLCIFSCKTAEPFTGDGPPTSDSPLRASNVQLGGDLVYNTTIDTTTARILKDIYAVPADQANYRYLDTMPCIMLVCDTMLRPTGAAYLDSAGEVNVIYSNTPDVWYKPGYVVFEKFAPWAKYSWLFEPAPPIFLDRRKKQLPPNIVVWMIQKTE